MIYLQPQTVTEALEAYASETLAGRKALWYSGGTEILSFLRKGTLKADTLIDLKILPAYTALETREDGWHIGGGVPLNRLLETEVPEVLKACVRPIADRTVRNRLTLAGNLCGRLPYREAVLPLWALEAEVTLAGPEGLTRKPLRDQFTRNMALPAGSFLLEVRVPGNAPRRAWGAVRKVRLGAVDYPVVHVLITGEPGDYTLCVSGLCPFPFRLEGLAADDLARPETLPLPAAPQEDRMATAAYRLHLFTLATHEALIQAGGAR